MTATSRLELPASIRIPTVFGSWVASVCWKTTAVKIGNLILSACEEKIRQLAQGPALARLGAQAQAKGFYLKNGYTATGEEYMDEYCPHIVMTKQL